MYYLFMGFAAVWLFITLYLVYIGYRQRRLDADMNVLRDEVEAKAKSSVKGSKKS